jgi:hypothetical protein
MSFNQKSTIDFNRVNTSTLKSNNISPQNIIFSNNEEWKQFWAKYGTNNEPKIDFSKYYVVGIFLGAKPNPGFGVEIKSIKGKNNYIQVEYAEYLPNPLMAYAQIAVYPYDMVYFPKTEGEIIFSGSKEIRK